MTVIVSKPAVNLREELASLRNQGGYQEQQFYFDGLVTNGTFDADTAGWTASANASLSLSSNALKITAVANGAAFASQAISGLTIGKKYSFTFDIVSETQSTGNPSYGSVGSNVAITSTGNFTAYFTADATVVTIRFSLGDAALAGEYLEVDNISIFEVDANDDVIHTMPKGWVPKDVYEDGLLQREGSAHDYEVVYDGFDYYVKPTVAPSATTQTCVIGVKA